jgi:hypothetical protein
LPRFLTLEEAANDPFLSEFRYRATGPAILFLLFFGIALASGIGAFRAWGASWLGVILLGWVAFWFGLFALLTSSMLRARLRPGAWLVRVRNDGVLLKFRSYLNDHFSAHDPTVVHIPFNDIAWCREHRVERTTGERYGPGDRVTRRVRYVEIKTSGAIATELAARLAAERARRGPRRRHVFGTSSTSSRHYPVQVSDGVVRIEWDVHPNARAFLDAIGTRVAIEQDAKSAVDYGSLEHLPKPQQEQRLLELVASGNRIEAIRAARRLYDLSLTDAVRFVDELSATKP